MQLDTILDLASQIGFTTAAPVNMEALVPLDEVRAMCSADRCINYNRSWSCPPAITCGTPESVKKKFEQFSYGVVLQYTAQMEDSFDMKVIREAAALHKKYFDTIVRQLKIMGEDFMAMGSGGCTRCRKCNYPNKPCRYPDRLYPSMEAYGLWVSDVCSKSGVAYNYGENTITYTACIIFK